MKGQSVELVPCETEADLAQLAEWASSDAGIYLLGSLRFLTAEQMKNVLHMAGPRVGVLLIRSPDGRTVGSVEWQQKTYAGSYSLNVMVGDPTVWGRGYGAEAASLAMELLFHEFNAHRVEIGTSAYNKRMMEMFTHRKFVHVEGVLRDYYFLDGEYHDAVVGSVLRHEYYDPANVLRSHPRELIPEAEKREARELLRKYMADNPIAGGGRRQDAPAPPFTGPSREIGPE